jgi:cellulase
MVYASKASSSPSWTKLWEDTFDGKTWAVDKLVAGSYTGKKGQHSMKVPAGLAPGEYLFRPEINALHEGNKLGGAQFYMACVHITVGGSGSVSLPAGVSLPGAYKATDAGILYDKYAGKTSYPPIGPSVWNGASSGGSTPATPATTPVASSKPAASSAAAVKTTLATVAVPAATPATGSVAKYAQCGGKGYSGATTCVSGCTCKAQNDYYSQCL